MCCRNAHCRSSGVIGVLLKAEPRCSFSAPIPTSLPLDARIGPSSDYITTRGSVVHAAFWSLLAKAVGSAMPKPSSVVRTPTR